MGPQSTAPQQPETQPTEPPQPEPQSTAPQQPETQPTAPEQPEPQRTVPPQPEPQSTAPEQPASPKEKEARRIEDSIPGDHYGTLGIDSNATQAQIKRAYAKLSLDLHPDKAKE